MSKLQGWNSAMSHPAVFSMLGALVIGAVLIPAAVYAVSAAPADTPPAPAAAALKIGIVGTGHIGGTLATLWVQAGHEVMMSSRHPQELQALAKSLGPRARIGTPRE